VATQAISPLEIPAAHDGGVRAEAVFVCAGLEHRRDGRGELTSWAERQGNGLLERHNVPAWKAVGLLVAFSWLERPLEAAAAFRIAFVRPHTVIETAHKIRKHVVICRPA